MIKLPMIKKLIGKNGIAKIKLILTYPNYRQVLNEIKNKKDSNYMLLIGTPIHDNLGDHLIAMSEKDLLRELYPKYKLFEIPTEMFRLYKHEIIKYIDKKALVFISGGGWMGNIWESDELLMQDIVYSFKENKTFIFPQTIFYDKNLNNYFKILNLAKQCYAKCDNLVISVRDNHSYEVAEKMLRIPKERIYSLPDVVLVYNQSLNKKQKKEIGAICIRKDCEKNNIKITDDFIEKELYKKNLKVCKTDTILKTFLSVKNREQVINKKLQEFSTYSLIITDRLHAMIMAVLVNTPCIVMDNRTGKVKGVYQLWLKNHAKVICIDSMEQLKESIENYEVIFSEMESYSNLEYKKMFGKIKEYLNRDGIK